MLREAEAISARHPFDERLAGYVASYLANQLTNIDSDAGTRYAERAAELLRRVEPRGDEMLGALLMIATTKRPSDPVAAENAASEAWRLVAQWPLDGLPKASSRNGRIADLTRESIGVLALKSR